MKKKQDAICSSCEWTGDALGLAACPACGGSLTFVDEKMVESKEEKDKYSEDELKVDDILDEQDDKTI